MRKGTVMNPAGTLSHGSRSTALTFNLESIVGKFTSRRLRRIFRALQDGDLACTSA